MSAPAAASAMGIASEGTDLRGQLDTVGYASRPEQMAEVWAASSAPPLPPRFPGALSPGLAGAIAPHDDYIYAGRVYRQVIPLVTAHTVVVVGVFHRYRRFHARDVVVFDPYKAWRTPEGPVPVSPLREEILAHLPSSEAVQSAALHDSEHSVEALVYWLKHVRHDLQIVPLIVPAAGLERLQQLALHVGNALGDAMARRGWVLGRDVAVVISADAVHYGADFKYVPFGPGGVEAYQQATQRDRAILSGPLSGEVTIDKISELFSQFVDPAALDNYRLTWCGRFSIPLGLGLLSATAKRFQRTVVATPISYSTSLELPEVAVRSVGLGATAPANLHHFVGHPAVALTLQGRP